LEITVSARVDTALNPKAAVKVMRVSDNLTIFILLTSFPLIAFSTLADRRRVKKIPGSETFINLEAVGSRKNGRPN